MHSSNIVNSVFSGLCFQDKNQILKFVSEQAAKHLEVDKKIILEALTYVEEKHPSGIGDGIAIPHLKLDEAKTSYSLFIKLEEPVEFNAIDGSPVDMVFLLISPRKDGPLHLARLARISRLFRDKDVRSHLRKNNSDNTIRSFLYEPGKTTTNAA